MFDLLITFCKENNINTNDNGDFIIITDFEKTTIFNELNENVCDATHSTNIFLF